MEIPLPDVDEYNCKDLEREKTASNGKKLEDRARALLRESKTSPWLPDPDAMFLRKLSLLLHQLDETRRIGRFLQNDLLDQECFVWTELHGVEVRTPQYAPRRFPEWEKLHRQLHGIRAERRRTIQNLEERIQELHRSLLDAMEKQFQLGFDEDGT